MPRGSGPHFRWTTTPGRKALLHEFVARIDVFPAECAITVWIRNVPASVADLGATPHRIPLTGTRSFAPAQEKGLHPRQY